jgi:membrane protein YdbS with pleckstrin-like domain
MSEPRPSADGVERRTLSPRVRVIWGIRAVVGVAILTAMATVLVAATRIAPRWVPLAVGAVLLVVALSWVRLRYRRWAFEVRPDALYLERGVVTHVRTVAPYVRIQHVDTQRGPLERWLGLSTLVVYTAGSRGADVAIAGRDRAEASDLESRVKQLAIEAEGGDAV